MIRYFLTTLKGIAMGAADVVPGISGGTIAFMTGIYQELIDSLKSIDHIAVKKLIKLDIKAFWNHINGSFLLAVFSGILFSIFTLARLMTFLLVNHPIPLWSFFMGLVTASTIFIMKEVKGWDFRIYLSVTIGIAIAVWISLVSPTETSNALWFIFISGVIAICAMVLPGISGSFILLLMGKYAYMMSAINELNIPVIIVFVLGAATGLISFSHLLSWLFKKYHDITIALLAGFMVGSLVKVWPWKTPSLNYEGIDYPALPSQFEAVTGHSPQIFRALFFLIIGLSIVYVIEFLANTMKK